MNLLFLSSHSLAVLSGIGIIGYQVYRYFTSDYKVAIRNVGEREYTLVYSLSQLKKVIQEKKPSKYNKISFYFNPLIKDQEKKNYAETISTYIYMINVKYYYFGSTSKD